MKHSRSLSDNIDETYESPLAKKPAITNMNSASPPTLCKQPNGNGKSNSRCSSVAPTQSANPLDIVGDNRDSGIDLNYPEKATESPELEECSKQELSLPEKYRDSGWDLIFDTLAAREVQKRENMEADKRRRLLISSVADPAAIQEAVELRRTIRRSTYYPPVQGLQLSPDDLQALERQFSADVHVQLESM